MASCSSSDHPESSHPIPQWPILINRFIREQEGDKILFEETSPVILERRPPTPPRRRMPIVILSPTSSADSTPYAPRSPSPGTYAQFVTQSGIGFDVGRDIRPIAPITSYDPWADRNTAPAPPAKMDASEFWDNVKIPYSAYFPSDHRSPGHWTLPPAGYRNTASWDQSIQNWELTPEPVPTVQEPVASSSTTHLYSWRYSYWQNVEEQHTLCRSPHCPPWATTWERLANRLCEQPQPPPELLAPLQPWHGRFQSETSGSDTVYEPRTMLRLIINGIPESPKLSPKPTLCTTPPT